MFPTTNSTQLLNKRPLVKLQIARCAGTSFVSSDKCLHAYHVGHLAIKVASLSYGWTNQLAGAYAGSPLHFPNSGRLLAPTAILSSIQDCRRRAHILCKPLLHNQRANNRKQLNAKQFWHWVFAIIRTSTSATYSCDHLLPPSTKQFKRTAFHGEVLPWLPFTCSQR